MTRSPARLWWHLHLHLHPLTFLGAEPEALPPGSPVVHRLPRLQRWLEHAAGLGADGLLLGPVFASGSHGYDTVDYDRVDPRLGDDEVTVAVPGPGWEVVRGAADVTDHEVHLAPHGWAVLAPAAA